MSEHEHFHAHGRDCCSHPDCVKSEDRRLAKHTTKALAKKIKTKPYDAADAKALADAVLVILGDD